MEKKLTMVHWKGEAFWLEVLDFGVFRQIKDRDAFNRARVAFDTIEWDCGVDLDPEFVYARCKGFRTVQPDPPGTERAPCR